MAFCEQLKDVLDRVAEKDVLPLGDFNAKHQEWLSRDATNVHGSTLKDLMDRFDQSQLCCEHTHMNNDGVPTSFLDLVFYYVPDLSRS